LVLRALADAGAPRLFSVLQRGLAALPAARFADMAELLTTLERAPRRGRGWFWLVAAIVALAAAVVATSAWRGHRGVNLSARSVATPPIPVPAAPSPSVHATPADAAATTPSAQPSPRAPTHPSAASAPAAPSEKRRPPKPGEVRYKDWLKDPF
jgi:hypothetical protein